MTKCPVCNELISQSSTSCKASIGFIDMDGVFHDDESIIIHIDCMYDYTFNPFVELEERIKKG
jgi:hypothetical protein